MSVPVFSSEPTKTSAGVDRLKSLIRGQEKAQATSLLAASLTAAIVSAAAVLLLGLSGWFITAAAIAGLAGPIVASTFNYLIPSALIRFLAIVRTASRYGERMTGHTAALNALAALRPALFKGLSEAPIQSSLSLSSGEASARLVQDVDAIQNHFVRLSAPWGAIAGLAAGLGMALIAGWQVALAIALIAFAGLGVCALLGRRLAEPAGHEVQKASGEMKSRFSALAAAAPELQAYGARDWAVTHVADGGNRLDLATRQLARAGSVIMVIQSLGMALAVAAVVATGPVQQPPLMALALLAAITTIESSGNLLNAIRQRGSVNMAVSRLGELLDVQTQGAGLPQGQEIYLATAGLHLSPPQRLAITGASGSGKTTLIERWMHLRPPVEHETRIGGVDVCQLSTKETRSLFAYAPQQTILLNGSVRENLRLALPQATDEQMWAVLETACLADRVRQSDKGLDMALGENGAVLSGGERRRLGLARAYLRPAPWLVLDEPTEGLDQATQGQVLSRLEQHLSRNSQGLVLISHRQEPLYLCQHHLSVQGLSASGRVRWDSKCPSENAA